MYSNEKMRKSVRNTAAALLCVSFAVAAAGCESLIKTDNEADMSRVVAEVNITNEKDFAKDGKYAAYKDVVGESNGKIYKRDLISAFLSSGYSSVQGGATYKDTFNKLLDTLVARKITVQYSMAYFLSQGEDYTVDGYKNYIAAQSEELKDVESEKRAQILTLKYFLTEGGTAAADDNDYNRVVYSLKKAVNASLDSSETAFMRATDKDKKNEIVGADETARSLPSGITTEKSDYYTDTYEIYTGYNTPDSCGEYEKQENSTTYSRRAAYNQFLSNLVSNGLISDKIADTTDFLKIDYYYVELLSQLEQSMINKLAEDLDKKAGESLTEDKVKKLYNEELAAQKEKYDKSLKDFQDDIGALSETKFVLYAPEKAAKDAATGYKYGYVYNLLIPFSATETQRISAYKNDADEAKTEKEKAARMQLYYAERAKAADKIVAKDQRTSWFSNDKASNYAKKNETDGKWYFFSEYMSNNKRYETATHYDSSIAFDGSVIEENGKIKSVSVNKNNRIVKFVNDVFEAKLGVTTHSTALTSYDRNPTANAQHEFDWKDFMLMKGRLDVGAETVALKDYFADVDSAQYKALTAVNELVYAYGTDPGALGSYIGYTVTPTCDETFVKEFAYAAKEAVAGGVGTYTVCLTDYGWHIMYCNYVYDAGVVYGEADDIFAESNKVNGEYKENTFARYFYDSVKAKLDENSAIVQERMLADYNTENAVTKHTARYQDLLDMDNNA